MNADSTQALWARLGAAGLASGAMPAPREAHAPWFVRLMLGIAGFIAAAFLVGFVGAAFAFVMKNAAAAIAVGLAAIAGAYAIFRAAQRSDFGTMFALAVSFAGQGLVAIGLVDLMDHSTPEIAWGLVAVMEAILALAVPNFIHRVASAYGAGAAFTLVLADGGSALAVAVLAAAVAAVWLNELRLGKIHELLAPLGYGLTLAYLQAEISSAFHDSVMREAWIKPWVGQGLVAATLIATAAALLRRAGWIVGEPRSLVALLATAAIGAASFKAPGVAGGLMIVLLGFANGNRLLTGAGIAALLLYVSRYYYLLDATLLVKSGVLALTGAALLAARWLLLSFVLPKGAKDA